MNIYEEKMAEAMRHYSNRIDFDLLWSYPQPDNIHLTKGGLPDKRYKNWLEANNWLKERDEKYSKDFDKFIKSNNY